MTTSGQICKMSYTAYCRTNCNMGQPYCNILQYAFCRIVSPLAYCNMGQPYSNIPVLYCFTPRKYDE